MGILPRSSIFCLPVHLIANKLIKNNKILWIKLKNQSSKNTIDHILAQKLIQKDIQLPSLKSTNKMTSNNPL